MKTKLLILTVLACVAFGVAGCSSVSYPDKLAAFDELGITEATITGKFSNTEYKRVQQDGKTVSTFDHSNAWMPKVHIKRERPLVNSKPE